MPGSATSVFSEAEDFEAALRAEGCVGLLVTGGGAFRARLTQITLDRLRLASAEEEAPHEDFKINGQYVNTPAQGVVGIPFFDDYVEKASLDYSLTTMSRRPRSTISTTRRRPVARSL